MLPDGSCIICTIYIWHIFAGLDLYDADPAKHLITAGKDLLDDLDRDLSDVCVFFFAPIRGYGSKVARRET